MLEHVAYMFYDVCSTFLLKEWLDFEQTFSPIYVHVMLKCVAAIFNNVVWQRAQSPIREP